MQTCIVLAATRNIAYYTSFWTLMSVSWGLMFVLAPLHSQVGRAYGWASCKTKSAGQVRILLGKHIQYAGNEHARLLA